MSVEGPEEGSTLITDHFPTDLPSKYGGIGTLELGRTHIWPIATDWRKCDGSSPKGGHGSRHVDRDIMGYQSAINLASNSGLHVLQAYTVAL